MTALRKTRTHCSGRLSLRDQGRNRFLNPQLVENSSRLHRS
jgi:hypothetical protein